MSLHGKMDVKIFLMFIVAENTRSVNIPRLDCSRFHNHILVDFDFKYRTGKSSLFQIFRILLKGRLYSNASVIIAGVLSWALTHIEAF